MFGTEMNFNEMVLKLDEAVDRFSNLRRNPDENKRTLHEQIELTQELYDFITRSDGKPDTDILKKIFLEAEADIPGWLLDIPYNLAIRGMVDEAVGISRQYSEVFETENFVGDLAVMFAEAGRKEEAIKQVSDNLTRFPEDVWIVIKAGDVFEALKDNEKAIELYKRVYEMTEPRTYDRDGVLERLAPLLRDMGRENEADELIKREELIEKEEGGTDYSARKIKVGRNEPCPCGSGKKFKKCCGK